MPSTPAQISQAVRELLTNELQHAPSTVSYSKVTHRLLLAWDLPDDEDEMVSAAFARALPFVAVSHLMCLVECVQRGGPGLLPGLC